MLPNSTILTLTVAQPTGIALSQTLGAAGALTLNGALVSAGIATLSPARRVGITSAANDSGITWTITGTNGSTNLQSETIAGGSFGAAQSNFDYLTVTSIVGSGATAGAVTAGTTSVGSTRWLISTPEVTPFNVGIGLIFLSGTASVTVEHTYDDPNRLPANVTYPYPFAHPILAGITSTTDGGYSEVIVAYRATMTGVGSVRMASIQAGVRQ